MKFARFSVIARLKLYPVNVVSEYRAFMCDFRMDSYFEIRGLRGAILPIVGTISGVFEGCVDYI